MPYKDKSLAKKKSAERMRRMREGVTKSDVTPENVTPVLKDSVTPDVHPIVYQLADLDRRAKLRTLCKSVRPWMLTEIYVGMPGQGGIPLGHVAELLTAFEEQ